MWCSCIVCAQSQQALRFSRYTTTGGLSSNNVTSILQDNHGFMWFGTQDGLNRFDGRSFITYKHDPSNVYSISGNVINDLALDDKGIIWIGTTDGGLCSYDFRTNRFKSYSFQRSDFALTFTPAVNSVAIDHQQRIWAGVEKVGAYVFNAETDSFRFLGHESLIARRTVTDIVADDHGRVYFSTIGGSLSYLDANGGYRSISNFVTKYLFPAYTITSIYRNKAGELWCGGWDNGLYFFDPDTDTLKQYLFETGKPFSYSGNELHAINEDHHGNLWLGMKSGDVYLFDPLTKKSYHYPPAKDDQQGLKAGRIYCIYRDRSNRMWLGTDAGLHVYDPLLNPFEIIDLNKRIATSSADLKVMDFLKGTDGTLYIGTKAGLLIKKPGHGDYVLKQFRYKNQDLHINKIYRDSRGTIYFGTQSSMFVFEPKNLTLSTVNYFSDNYYYFDFYNIGSSNVNAIAEAVFMNDTVLWVSAYGHGLCLFDRNTLRGGIGILGDTPELQNLIRKIWVDSKGRVWMIGASLGLVTNIQSDYFSMNDSLWRRNPSVASRLIDSFGMFKGTAFRNNKKEYSLRSNDVVDMVENEDGTFWITTKGSGLYLFDPDDSVKTFIHFESQHQNLEGIARDKNGNLWIIAAGGIDFFDVKSKAFFRYDQVHGIPDEGVTGYFYKDEEGYLYAGGNGFYLRFKPDEVQRNTLSPPVFITRMKVMDQPADSLLLQSEIRLNYNQNFLSFDMAALNFTNAAANQFSYRLQGFDKEWIQNNYSNQASYTNIPPGKYTLQVKASNNDGVWNEAGTSLLIIIDPPWWQTWWFYLMLIAAIASALYGIYRYRVNQLLKLQHIRNKIARDLHDDIGSTLGSISFFSEAAKQQLSNNNVDASQNVIEKIGEHSRNMIETMSDIVWSVNPENDAFGQLTARMQSFASDLLSMQDIRLHFHVDENLNKIRLNMEQRKNIFMIYKEALYNIVKYADCTEVDITICDTGKKMMLEISDNGRGFDVQQVKSYNGNGLKNMRSRAGEIDATLTLQSELKTGTTIRLLIGK